MKKYNMYKFLGLLLVLLVVLVACGSENTNGIDPNDNSANNSDNGSVNDGSNDTENNDNNADDRDDEDKGKGKDKDKGKDNGKTKVSGTVEAATESSITLEGVTYEVDLAEYGVTPEELIGAKVNIQYIVDDEGNLTVVEFEFELAEVEEEPTEEEIEY